MQDTGAMLQDPSYDDENLKSFGYNEHFKNN